MSGAGNGRYFRLRRKPWLGGPRGGRPVFRRGQNNAVVFIIHIGPFRRRSGGGVCLLGTLFDRNLTGLCKFRDFCRQIDLRIQVEHNDTGFFPDIGRFVPLSGFRSHCRKRGLRTQYRRFPHIGGFMDSKIFTVLQVLNNSRERCCYMSLGTIRLRGQDFGEFRGMRLHQFRSGWFLRLRFALGQIGSIPRGRFLRGPVLSFRGSGTEGLFRKRI